MNTEDQALVALFDGLDTPSVSDALDKLGLHGQALNIMPLADYPHTVVGPAYTVKYVPADNPAGTVGDFIDDVAAGEVVVIDNDGRTDCTVWGDILTEIAHRRGIAGTVIDGICRDVALALELGYPVFSRGHWMRTGKDRVQVEAVNVPVNVGHARVCPGDLLRGDADGVIVIPAEHEEQVLAAAEQIHAAEAHIRQAVKSGKRLDEARREYGYHSLQTREK